MPCVVPTCGASVGTFKLFPQHKTLSARWLEAIQVGCGVKAADDGCSSQMEICHWHFAESAGDGYQEPKIFLNCKTGKLELDSCRLCLRFHPICDMVSEDGKLSGMDIKSIVYESLGIDFHRNEFLKRLCLDCLARLELLKLIQKDFMDAEFMFQNLIGIIREAKELPPPNGAVNQEAQADSCTSELDDGMHEEYSSDEWTPPTALADIFLNQSDDGAKHESNSSSCDDSKQPELSLKEIIARKCYICPVILESANELSSHLIEKHSSDKINRCEECSRDFPMLSGYNKHLSRHDQTERPNKCSFCPMRFKYTRGMLMHENTHHGTEHNVTQPTEKVKPAICETCGESFKYMSMLTRHVRLKHTESSEKPKCKICDKIFTRHGSLTRHMQLHSNKKPYSCDKCEASFQRLLSLKHHVQQVHEGKNPHVCVECNQEFKMYEALYHHRRLVHQKRVNKRGGTQRRIIPSKQIYAQKCELCDVKFPKTSELRHHISTTHADVSYPYYECPHCAQKFLSKKLLYDHKSRHTNRCVCAECGKPFSTAQGLRHHIESIHEKRQFDCPTCPKTYKSQSALYVHLAVHKKGKQLSCDFCDKCFHRKDHLRIHRRIHTGEKPFECPNCLKRFSDNGTFHHHKKRCLAMVTNKNGEESVNAILTS